MEYREIGFTDPEKEAAILNYCLMHDITMPESDIRELIIEDGATEEITLKLNFNALSETGIAPDSITLNQEQIAAAFVLYCQACKIPIPRVGLRSLRVSDNNQISLVVRIDRTPRKD